jgi:enamine deaminase RidA (YjgF/YER057c/UK114 family)
MTTAATTPTTTPTTTAVNPWTWQDQMGFSQGILVEGAAQTLYAAGQGSVDADGRPLHVGDMQAQVGQALDNVEAVLAAAGMTLRDVVRYEVFTTDVDAFLPASGQVAQRFGVPAPAGGGLLGVARLAYPEMLVEIKVTAVR